MLCSGADINARDARFLATPAGWAIEYLRQRGALLGMEIEDKLVTLSLTQQRGMVLALHTRMA